MLIAVRVCLSLSVVQPYCLFPCCMCVTRRNNTSNFRELLFCHCSVHFHWSFFYYFWMSDFYVFHVAPNSWDRSPLNVSMWSICWMSQCGTVQRTQPNLTLTTPRPLNILCSLTDLLSITQSVKNIFYIFYEYINTCINIYYLVLCMYTCMYI